MADDKKSQEILDDHDGDDQGSLADMFPPKTIDNAIAAWDRSKRDEARVHRLKIEKHDDAHKREIEYELKHNWTILMWGVITFFFLGSVFFAFRDSPTILMPIITGVLGFAGGMGFSRVKPARR